MQDLPLTIAIFAGFLFCIIVHECAHAIVAHWRGDDTAMSLGRFTLNPIPHIDPFFSILLPFVLWMSDLPIFGGAKPVPVNMNNLRGNRLTDMSLVALAGPVSNVLLAAGFALLLNLVPMLIHWNDGFGRNCLQVLVTLVYINCALAIFNMLPIPPLDGSRILAALLPNQFGWYIYDLGRFGLLFVAILVMSGVGSRFYRNLIHLVGKGLIDLLVFVGNS